MFKIATGPASTVSLKTTGVNPATDAVISTTPDFVPVVYEVVALPAESVVAVGEDNIPPAPPSEKLTWIPAIPLPNESLTLTLNGRDRAVVTTAFCAFPETIDNFAGLFELAVSVKIALAYPGLDAVMVYIPGLSGRV